LDDTTTSIGVSVGNLNLIIATRSQANAYRSRRVVQILTTFDTSGLRTDSLFLTCSCGWQPQSYCALFELTVGAVECCKHIRESRRV